MRQMRWNVEKANGLQAHIPNAPGVYLMRDGAGKIIYIGKARDLKSRVAQYFQQSGDNRPFVALLAGQLERIDTVVCQTEKDALLLENELIKRHKPVYNILLRDDKAYLYLRIDPSQPWPRLDLVRRRKDDGALYFGPHHNAGSIRATHALLSRHFGLRTCRDHVFANRSRPCLEYQMKRCLGPCVYSNLQEEYARRVELVVLFLRGRHDDLKQQLTGQMQEAAKTERFEEAARIRDQLSALSSSLSRQTVVLPDRKDTDSIGVTREGGQICFTVLRFEGGVLCESIPYSMNGLLAPTEELLESFIIQFYRHFPIGARVLLPSKLPLSTALIQEVLRGMCSHGVTVHQPIRGILASTIQMAQQNAQHLLSEALATAKVQERVLQRLSTLTGLSGPFSRIEGYDMSTFQGDATTGAMVVFEKGRPNRRAYRTFGAQGIEDPGDVGMMRHVLQRRFSHPPEEIPLPDLVLVDGGEDQLETALQVLFDASLSHIPVVAIAESRVVDRGFHGPLHSLERLYIQKEGKNQEIIPAQHDDALRLLMRIRDEAHRFVNAFHRKRRIKKETSSLLDQIPGLGKVRRTALLRHFGSVSAIKKASLEELKSVPKMTNPLAKTIIFHLHGQGS